MSLTVTTLKQQMVAWLIQKQHMLANCARYCEAAHGCWLLYFYDTVNSVFVIVTPGSADGHSSSTPSTPSSVDRMVEDMMRVDASPVAGSVGARALAGSAHMNPSQRSSRLDPSTIHIGSVSIVKRFDTHVLDLVLHSFSRCREIILTWVRCSGFISRTLCSGRELLCAVPIAHTHYD